MSSSSPAIGPPDVAIGTVFPNRVALAEARVHRMRMHGIAWSTDPSSTASRHRFGMLAPCLTVFVGCEGAVG
jgi:hypothetical protein